MDMPSAPNSAIATMASRMARYGRFGMREAHASPSVRLDGISIMVMVWKDPSLSGSRTACMAGPQVDDDHPNPGNRTWCLLSAVRYGDHSRSASIACVNAPLASSHGARGMVAGRPGPSVRVLRIFSRETGCRAQDPDAGRGD